MQRTSDLVRDAIAHVRDNHPYWNASGGADHFMVFSYDHGKCEMAKALQFEEFGKMFSVQAYGSLVYRCSSTYQIHAAQTQKSLLHCQAPLDVDTGCHAHLGMLGRRTCAVYRVSADCVLTYAGPTPRSRLWIEGSHTTGRDQAPGRAIGMF